VEGTVTPRILVAGLTSLLVSACTSSEPTIEVEPEAAEPVPLVSTPSNPPVYFDLPPNPKGPPQALGPLLGGIVVERAPTPGRWASRVDFHQHRFITVEHTVESSVSGSAVLRLSEDGSVRACFSTDESSASDISHYQAHDGKDHHYASAHAVVVGMTGSWKLDGEGPQILVEFDRMTWNTCEVDSTREAFAQPPLRCFGFAANGKVPGDALFCRVPEELNWIATLSLLVGDSPRAGAWAHRHDPSGHGVMPPEDAVPCLLLGADPGFELRASDTDRDAEPLTIRVAEVADPKPLPPADSIR
jgi:hypothetical protein